IHDDPRDQPDDSPVAMRRQFHILNVVTPVRRREKALPTAFAPSTRAAGANRQQGAEDVLGIEPELGTKSAADVRGDEPEKVQRKTKTVCQRPGMCMGQLTRGVVC